MAVVIDFNKMKEVIQIRKDLNTDYTAIVNERVGKLVEYNKTTNNPLFAAFGEAYKATLNVLGPIQTSCLIFGYARQEEHNQYHGLVVSNSALSVIGAEEAADHNHRILDLHYVEDAEVPKSEEAIDVQTARQQFNDYITQWSETNHAGCVVLIYELIQSLVDRGYHPRPIKWSIEDGKVSSAKMYFQSKDILPGKSAHGYILISFDFDKVWEIGEKIDNFFKENQKH